MDFQDVKKVVSDAAHKVAQKSGEAVEYGKIKYAIYDIQNDINKIFTSLGQDVYENYKSESECGDVSQSCEIIDAKKQEIEELEAKLADLKNNKKCPDCGKVTKKEDAFCPACGISF